MGRTSGRSREAAQERQRLAQRLGAVYDAKYRLQAGMAKADDFCNKLYPPSINGDGHLNETEIQQAREAVDCWVIELLKVAGQFKSALEMLSLSPLQPPKRSLSE
jgi:hypothetical protein